MPECVLVQNGTLSITVFFLILFKDIHVYFVMLPILKLRQQKASEIRRQIFISDHMMSSRIWL